MNPWSLTKKCMRRSIGKKKLPLEVFRTVISEIANEVNSRPITYESDAGGNLTALTPNHFLNFNSDQVEDPDLSEREDLYAPDTHDKVLGKWEKAKRWLKDFKAIFLMVPRVYTRAEK